MKTWGNSRHGVLLGTVLVTLSAVGLYAQSEKGLTPGSRMYDPNTETTFKAVVQEVKEVPGPGRGTGTHLTVKSGNDVYDVHVGPTWYLKQQKCTFATGDEVEVTGSKVKYQGADVIIARQIKKDGGAWTLRNARGIPLWSRGQNR
jgi:hypothetical protein